VNGGRALEIGAGLRTTAPVAGSFFIETSPTAARTLAANGGHALVADGVALPFADGSFHAVIACEVLEHIEEDTAVMSEMARILDPEGLLLMSVPVHMARWSATDDACAHVRRYEPDELMGKLRGAGFEPEGYTARGGGGHPTAATVGSKLLHGMPRLSNWWLQNVIFRAQSAWLSRRGTVAWTDPSVPVSPEAGGMLVLCRRAG
jgi:SAM-dependent methyltransferase